MVVVRNNIYLKKFGNHIQGLRKQRKLSLRKMAANCNIENSDISRIEKGKTNIQLLTLLELAKALNLEPRELLDFKFDLENEIYDRP